MEIGMSSFAETTPDVETGEVISHAPRLREIVEEIVLAVGLDVYGLGEHHCKDFAASSPAVVLAAAGTQTKRIRLTSAVRVLSSDNPVRVYQDFATLDGLSNGRAEITWIRKVIKVEVFSYGLLKAPSTSCSTVPT